MKDNICINCKHYRGNKPRHFGNKCALSKDRYVGHSEYEEVPLCKHHPSFNSKPNLFKALEGDK